VIAGEQKAAYNPLLSLSKLFLNQQSNA